MSDKPFAVIKGCTLELGLEPGGTLGCVEYWEKITDSSGRLLRYTGTNTDGCMDGIDSLVTKHWIEARQL